MKPLYHYLRDFLQEHFQWKYYLLLSAFLGLCLYVNYTLDFEDSILDLYYGKPIGFLYYFLYFAFAYYGACALYALCYGKWNIFSSRVFWLRSLFVLGLLALDKGFYFFHGLIANELPPEVQYFSRKVINNLIGILSTLIPLFLFYLYFDRQQRNFYGFNRQKFLLRPYAYLLVIMLVVVSIASFFENFNNFYPIYKSSLAHVHWGIPEAGTVAVYELAYGFNFISIELLFRGFMVLGLAKVMGRQTVLPMVCAYCFLHFGKPSGEAISSIFGGFVLGVFAYESRSIYGGVLLHVGIAWMMELAAYLQE